MKIKLNEFSLKMMTDHPTICMIAKRDSGKSFIAKEILYYYRDLQCGAIISPTERTNPFYKDFFPDLFIHYDIKDQLLKRILLRQTLMGFKAETKRNQGKFVDPTAILIMDDCLARAKNWKKNVLISEIMMNGRHYKLIYILTMQTPLGIGPELRLNFDYVFLLKDNSSINMKKLFDNYASVFPSQRVFEKVFRYCTADFRCMVVNNKTKSSELADLVLWYKAPVRKKGFVVGSSNFRNLNNYFYDLNYKKRARNNLLGIGGGGDLADGGRKNDVPVDVEFRKR